jgi:apolipoprotein N-acyltransferase
MILKGLFAGILFSTFIYLDYFGISNKLILTICSIGAVYLYLTLERKSFRYLGLFIGLFWFWWVSLSLRYYDMIYFIPIVVLVFGIGYYLIFYIISIKDHIFIRGISLIGFSFIYPFNFNWFIPQVIFVDSYISSNIFIFSFLILGLIVFTKNRLNGIMMVFITIFISFALKQYKKPTIEPNLRIYMPNLDISQKDKWDIDKKDYLVELNLKYIQKAIEDKYDLILLSETSIPDIINTNQRLLDKLSKYSQKIDIIVGGLSQKNNIIYNSVYHFSQGKLQQIANKVVLVPFGEEIPLPQILVDWINETFYNGAKDYIPANNTTDFIVKGIRFRNSICYEATHYKMYHDNPKYMVALSNFAWFMPSIASILQKKLLKYYSLRYNTIIYHNINSCKNYIVK